MIVMLSTESFHPDADRAAGVAAVFRGERTKLWGLAYRLTGSAEDADDVVQETFARLLAQSSEPPAVERWLVRVATNLGIDTLRRRRRPAYPGPWLPVPVETPDGEPIALVEADAAQDPGSRSGLA